MTCFPKNFIWGASSSGIQTEGSSHKTLKNNWEHWFDTNPELFFDNVGPYKTINYREKMLDDVKLMKESGIMAYRTSIQWTRFYDDLEKRIINPDAVAFYTEMINEFKNAGIKLIIGLNHFEIPLFFQNKGGLLSRDFPKWISDYAEDVFKTFPNVDEWTTFNEPIVPCEMGYLMKLHFPALEPSLSNYFLSSFNIMMANAKIIKVFRETIKNKTIGIIVNMTPCISADDSIENQEATATAELIFNEYFLATAIKGIIPKEYIERFLNKYIDGFKVSNEEAKTLKENVVDFVGINYYFPRRVKAPEPNKKYGTLEPFSNFFVSHHNKNGVFNKSRGWEIAPEMIYKIAKNMENLYPDTPWFISESGIGIQDEKKLFTDKEGVVVDDYRIEFFKQHLDYLHKAIQEGSQCQGFFVWTFIDNWSWLNAFKNRYGLVAVDLETQTRTPKKSFHWFKNVILNNGY